MRTIGLPTTLVTQTSRFYKILKKVGIELNIHTVKLKQTNMLCNKCVLHVLQALTKLDEIKELEVNLEKKHIKVVYFDENVTREMITEIVNAAIEIKVPKKLTKVSHQKELFN